RDRYHSCCVGSAPATGTLVAVSPPNGDGRAMVCGLAISALPRSDPRPRCETIRERPSRLNGTPTRWRRSTGVAGCPSVRWLNGFVDLARVCAARQRGPAEGLPMRVQWMAAMREERFRSVTG